MRGHESDEHSERITAKAESTAHQIEDQAHTLMVRRGIFEL